MKDKLKGIKYFVLDMDGTIYMSSKMLPGALEFLDNLKKKGGKHLFLTNNSSKSEQAYLTKLNKLGCNAKKGDIVTSGMVTMRYLQKTYGNPRVFLMGSQSLVEDFLANDIELVEDNPTCVVAGFDTFIDYDRLKKFCDYVRNGVPYIATHPDVNCPSEKGLLPDLGSVIKLIEASTDKLPKILGKPYPETIEYIMEILNCDKSELCFVGDRLSTDVAIAINNGVRGILTLTGATKIEDVAKSNIKPTLIIKGIHELAEYYAK